MFRVKKISLFILLFAMLIFMVGCKQTQVAQKKKAFIRVGQVAGLKAKTLDEYKKFHADSNPGVRDLLSASNIHNFSIYLCKIDGKYYEFGYYEYTGDDYEADMAKLDNNPRNIEWCEKTGEFQFPVPPQTEEEGPWTKMERIYYNP